MVKLQTVFVDAKKTIMYLKKNGLSNTYYAAIERLQQRKQDTYEYLPPSEEDLLKQKEICESMCEKPLISLVVPTYETPEQYLHELLVSVQEQTYDNWELILADASESSKVADYLAAQTQFAKDTGIFYLKLEENAGISANTNEGIEAAKGDYICLLDHDDLLTPDALFHMVNCALKNRDAVLIYSDEDKTNSDKTLFYDVNDKYKFNYDLILSNNYICHLTMLRADYMKELKERSICDGAQDYDLVLRVIDKLLKQGIAVSALSEYILHVPKVLYHWRCHENSTAQNTASKMYAYEAGLKALQDFCDSRGYDAQIKHSLHLGFYDIIYKHDLMMERPEIGAIAGRVLNRKGCMEPCIALEKGEYLYTGLYKRFSGRMHRFAIRQDVNYASLKNIRLQEDLLDAFETVAGVPYIADKNTGVMNYNAFCDAYQKKYGEKPDVNKLSDALCEELVKQGYIILYDPVERSFS